MANERYEGVGPNGHYTLAERIFTKIKSLFDTKVKTDVPANAEFTDTLPTAYCDSAANATAKVAQCTGFSLKDNSYIPINFTNGNTVEAFTEVTLNINNTGAKPLYVNWSFEGGPKTSSPFDASTYIIYYTNNAYYLYTNGTLFPYKNVANITDIRYYTVDSEDNSVAVVEEQGPSLLGHPESWKVDLSVPLATTVSNGLLSAADKIKINNFEDTKVTQTESTNDEIYEVLISGTASTATTTEGVNKSKGFRYNPYKNAVMEGYNTTALGNESHAEGQNSYTISHCAHAEGTGTTASGDNSHSEGSYTQSKGTDSHAEGYYAIANGQGTHVEGYQNFSTTATAQGGHAEGFCTTISSGPGAHTEGFHTYADGIGSHAEGYYTTAKGSFPHAEGNYTYSCGDGTHAEGYKTTAKAYQSHAEGNYTYANNSFTHVEGNYSTGNGYYSHSEGDHSISSGVASHTEGCYTNATTTGAHAEGYGTSAKYNVACGTGSHVEGYGTCASGSYSHTEGESTRAGALCSHAEGGYTTASGTYSHAEGYMSYSPGTYSHSEGYGTTAKGDYSHAEGYQTSAVGNCSHSEGYGTKSVGYGTHTEGRDTTASGSYSHAEGYQTLAAAQASHAEGGNTYARSNYTHTEGYGTTANYSYGHAEGLYTYVGGSSGAHAEGYNTTANGNSSHAEGYSNLASGSQSHAEGYYSRATGDSAHAENNYTYANGNYSHTEGNHTSATHKSQHVFGEYNDLDASTATSSNRGNYVEIVGNGLSSTQLSNARTLDWNGNEKIAGNLTDKWGLQTSRTMFEEDFQQLTQAERDNGTTYYIPDREPLKICDYIYPIGAIYMSVNNISPAILFGGTWERIKDRFLLAAGDTYNVGSMDGEAEHILSEAELPNISGSWQIHAQENGTIFYNKTGYATGTTKSGQYKTQTSATSGAYSQQSPGFNFGQNQPHNNMPPYLVVNVWMRVPDPVQQEEEEGE